MSHHRTPLVSFPDPLYADFQVSWENLIIIQKHILETRYEGRGGQRNEEIVRILDKLSINNIENRRTIELVVITGS